MWLLLAFLTAFFTSLADVFSKLIIRKVDVYIIAWGSMFFSLPFLYAALVVQGIPPIGPSFGLALGASTALLVVATVLYFKAIETSDLSISMPMLAFTPLFLLVTSPVMLGEIPGAFGVIGIVLIVGGAYVIHFQHRHQGYMEPFFQLIRQPGPRYMLIVAVLYSIGSNVDKIGVVNSSPLMWITMMNTAVTLGIAVIMIPKVKQFNSQVRSVWPTLTLIGLFHALAISCQMVAITMTIVPYLIAVKRTSVIMTSLFGLILFKEGGGRERLVGAALMVLGVFIISFYS